MKKFYMSGSFRRKENSGYFALTVLGEELTEEFIKDCKEKIVEANDVDDIVILNIIELKG